MSAERTDEEVVIQVCRRQVQALISNNLEQLRSLTTADATFTQISGTKQSFDKWLAQIKKGRLTYFSARALSFQAMVMSDTATVVTRSKVDAQIYGMRSIWPMELHIQLRRIRGQWLIGDSATTLY